VGTFFALGLQMKYLDFGRDDDDDVVCCYLVGGVAMEIFSCRPVSVSPVASFGFACNFFVYL
jgi:hypothetical protein